jgi:cytoskeletal protein CcmA (bactofilin family)
MLKKRFSDSEMGHSGDLNTIVGKGSVVQGNMRIRNSVRIDGRVKGNVTTSDTVVVGKDGAVEGTIQAKHVLMAGKVKGDISASGKVVIEATSTVTGDVEASRLVVDEGAVFDGKCTMAQNTMKRQDTKAETADKVDQSGT